MIKSAGIVREVDRLGRVNIPVEFRSTMKIDKGDSLEIYVEENKIVLKKYEPGCFFWRQCGRIKRCQR